MIVDSILVNNFEGGSKFLVFGLDTTATNGIDLHLGERLLPPLPPPGAFDARLFLPENNFSGSSASWRDFRNMENIPFYGEKEFRIAYQTGFASGNIRISWDFPHYLTGLLQDLFGGVILNVIISDSGFIDIPIPAAINTLKLFIEYNLPVELTAFEARFNNNKVTLEWLTSSELNNRGFEVERTSPLPPPYEGGGGEVTGDWQAIGFVEGKGTTTEQQKYSFVDEKIFSGVYQYRLKQIDYDGTYEYSKVVEVDVTKPIAFSLEQNYPNPFNPETKIKFTIPLNVKGETSNVKLTVFDILGNEIITLVNEEKFTGSYEVTFNAEGLSSGMYFYTLQTGSFSKTNKMLMVK